jgi:hypothetical protein
VPATQEVLKIYTDIIGSVEMLSADIAVIAAVTEIN